MCVPKSRGGLGFRHIHNFNIALLGKQGCRLMCRPECLVATVFKARYYPISSFLAANIGSNLSFIWRSLLEAQDLLKKGTVCRVGSGASINIMFDPWLSCTDNLLF